MTKGAEAIHNAMEEAIRKRIDADPNFQPLLSKGDDGKDSKFRLTTNKDVSS